MKKNTQIVLKSFVLPFVLIILTVLILGRFTGDSRQEHEEKYGDVGELLTETILKCS